MKAIPAPETVPDAGPTVRRCRPGPWGPVEYYDTYLEAPESLIARLSLPSQQTVWHFEGMAREEIGRVFEAAGVSPEQLRSAMNGANWSTTGDLVRIFPTPELVESLTPESRAGLYRVLSRSALNPFHHTPIQFDRADLLQALDRSGLPAELVRHIAGLTYREGRATLFSDFPVLLRHLRHPQQERKLLRILTRTRTLVAHLNLNDSVDLPELQDYWSPDRRQPGSRPLMESVIDAAGIDTLDIVQLLPPGPRSRLFTFPDHDDCLSGRAPDGVWTAVNFFRYEPLPIHLQSPSLAQHLETRFRPVSQPFHCGDVFLFAPADGPGAKETCHACVYVADDIVYTKNGAQLMSPWILAKLDDVVPYHVRGVTAEIRVLRPLLGAKDGGRRGG